MNDRSGSSSTSSGIDSLLTSAPTTSSSFSSAPPLPPAEEQQRKQQQIRAEMVQAAKQFLTNPRVRLTPVAEQREFLKGKGLSEAEIQSALADIAEQELRKELEERQQKQQLSSSNSSYHSALGQIPTAANSRANSIVEIAKSFMVFGSAGYIFYRFVRSWLLPQLMGIPDPVEERMQRLEEELTKMGDANRAIADTLAQTLSTVTDQNEQISRTLLMIQSQNHHFHQQQNNASGGGEIVDQQALMAEIGIVKSLLLNPNQFPPIPPSALAPPPSSGLQRKLMNGEGGGKAAMVPKNANAARIPEWQRRAAGMVLQNGRNNNGGVEKKVEEEEEEEKEDREEANNSSNNGNCSADGSEV